MVSNCIVAQNVCFVQVSKPHIGENHPSQVRADITVTLNLRHEIKREWEGKVT